MRSNVVHCLIKQFALKPSTKVVCENLFKSMDLLDHPISLEVGVVGTIYQNK
jgi:hypothetical protein